VVDIEPMNELLRTTVEALHGLPPEAVVFIVSALPIFEIRGGVIAGLVIYELPIERVLVFGFLGNIASVTPLLLFLEPLSKWLYRNPQADRLLHWLFARVQKKAEQINRWGPLGLMLFTAIPLPASGAWTATFASILLGVRRWRAILSIYAGIILAGIAVALLTIGVSGGLQRFLGL
jgi:uncharacterized membrane protein